MAFFQTPTSFRLRQLANGIPTASSTNSSTIARRDTAPFATQQLLTMAASSSLSALNDHSSHPNFLHLAGLVCEAVLEVVFVALPGYIAARSGFFNAENQKFVAELNVNVFTPALIFYKLASQLNAETLVDLAIIPVIFVAQTLVSYFSAGIMSWVFGFRGKKMLRQRNFVTAMAVFGNSNSLPISLVLSLSHTIAGLHWDQIPGDNDNEVGARGILYLLIFQQLGQLVRWTWGFNVLLKPKSAYEEEESDEELEEEDRYVEEGRYRDDPDEDEDRVPKKPKSKATDSGFGSGSQTPVSTVSTASSEDDDREGAPLIVPATPANGNINRDSPFKDHNISPTSSRSAPDGALYSRARSTGHITTFPNFSQTSTSGYPTTPIDPDEPWYKRTYHQVLAYVQQTYVAISSTLSTFFNNLYRSFPTPAQKVLSVLGSWIRAFLAGVWRQMNPPLWAMLAALLVASIPSLQHLFFDPGTLINNSVTRAVQQSGGVAVPLILVVLGANLARSTLPQSQLASTPVEKREERKLLAAALISRMLLPTLIMAPILALMAKYVPVSIMDDPIFIIVCFLLTGAPSALQLAQICQINEVFMGAMSNLLVWSYVVAIFPSTLMLVLLALEVLEWAVL